MRSVTYLLVAWQIVTASAINLPSCAADEEAHCIGEGADLSREGISACLAGLGSKTSEGCLLFNAVLKGCTAEIKSGEGGVCESAHRDGETMACIFQRVQREQLSEACLAVMPEEEEPVGLQAKFWKDGKVELDEDEVAELDADDKDTYKRWIKKKNGKKTERQRERDYAVRTQKKDQATKLIKAACKDVAAQGIKDGNAQSATMAVAKATADAAVKDDKTGTLKPFTKAVLNKIVNDAIAEAKNAKKEL